MAFKEVQDQPITIFADQVRVGMIISNPYRPDGAVARVTQVRRTSNDDVVLLGVDAKNGAPWHSQTASWSVWLMHSALSVEPDRLIP